MNSTKWSPTWLLVGTIVATWVIVTSMLRLVQFLYLHFVYVDNLSRYLRGGANNIKHKDTEAWTLVTGSSDGIGASFVDELAGRGFNVILHGRNSSKIENLITEMRRKHPSRSFKAFIVDASQEAKWAPAFAALITDIRTSGMKLTVLINNVGGGAGGGFPAFQAMTKRDPKSIQMTINLNVCFPATITHALLPLLAEQKPSLIVNIGSVVALFPPPYLALYAGCKSFNICWSRSLVSEMVEEGIDIEVMAVMVGTVLAQHNRGQPSSLFTPTSQLFARRTLEKVGCGKAVVASYWPHQIQIWAMYAMPEWLRTKVLNDATLKEMETEQKRL